MPVRKSTSPGRAKAAGVTSVNARAQVLYAEHGAALTNIMRAQLARLGMRYKGRRSPRKKSRARTTPNSRRTGPPPTERAVVGGAYGLLRFSNVAGLKKTAHDRAVAKAVLRLALQDVLFAADYATFGGDWGSLIDEIVDRK